MAVMIASLRGDTGIVSCLGFDAGINNDYSLACSNKDTCIQVNKDRVWLVAMQDCPATEFRRGAGCITRPSPRC